MAKWLRWRAELPRPAAFGPRRLVTQFSRDYWAFFLAAFCMDLGFGLFVFLFNLYLTDLHFDERLIGKVLACFTIGNVAGTIPALVAARRCGLRPLLLFAFGAVPGVAALRVLFVWQPAQLVLAFLTGAALCAWPICFAPMIAQLTGDENRAAGFSVAFATGIGLGSLAGLAGGYLPELLHQRLFHLSIVNGIRVVLLLACGIVLVGVWPMVRLRVEHRASSSRARLRIWHPYLLRFLPGFLLWNILTGSLPLFGAVYLQKALGIPLVRLGVIFGVSQFMQFLAVLGTPVLFRRLGIARGVCLALFAAAALLLSMAEMHFGPAAICCYVLYFAAQYMCGPGIYQMLMERIPEAQRSSASAIQNLSGALCQAGTAAISGACIVAYGYRTLLFGNAAVAVGAALLFAWLGIHESIATAQGRDEVDPSGVPLGSEWMFERVAK